MGRCSDFIIKRAKSKQSKKPIGVLTGFTKRRAVDSNLNRSKTHIKLSLTSQRIIKKVSDEIPKASRIPIHCHSYKPPIRFDRCLGSSFSNNANLFGNSLSYNFEILCEVERLYLQIPSTLSKYTARLLLSGKYGEIELAESGMD